MTQLGIGYVLRMYPQTSETFIANEVLELERRGAAIEIYSYRRPKAPVAHESVRSIRAPVIYLPDPMYLHPGQFLEAHRALRRLTPERYRHTVQYVLSQSVKERNPDTVRRFLQAGYLAYLLRDTGVRHLHAHFAHGATRVAMLASMLSGVPFSFTAHARDIFAKDVDLRLLREKLEMARFAVTVSQHNKDYLRRALGPIVDERVHVVYNGVDLQKFSPDPSVRREDGLILAVGRLVEKKGFPQLIAACRLLRDRGLHFRCEIVGGGELRERLERAVRRGSLEDTVHFAGTRSQEEVVAYYRRAALVVMPAVVGRDGNRDALPTVLLEAMASGTPVVASRLTGIPEIVDHDVNGFLVEPEDVAGLADAIARLLRDRMLRDRFGAVARTKAEYRFDLHKNVEELHRLFGQGVAAPQGLRQR